MEPPLNDHGGDRKANQSSIMTWNNSETMPLTSFKTKRTGTPYPLERVRMVRSRRARAFGGCCC